MPVALKRGVLSGLCGDLCKPDPCERPEACRPLPAPPALESVAPAGTVRKSGAAGSMAWGRFSFSAWALLGLSLFLAGCGPAGRRDLLEGQRLLATGHADAAIGAFRDAVRAFSTNAPAGAQAWNYLGIAYHQLGQFDNAGLCYKAALDKDLNLFAARYNRGFLYLERTNYAAAISELTTYTTQLPDDPAGWLLLGKAQLRAGLIEPAQQSLQRVRRLPAPAVQQAEALNALGVGYARRRKAPEAFQHFEAALNRVADYPPAILNQAILSQQLNDRAFALQKFQAYLEVATNSPLAGTVRGLTNQLVLALAAARPPATPLLAARTNPPPEPGPTNLALAAPTSPPPATVRTSAAPVLAQSTATSAPPAELRSSPPPVLVLTSPPPATVRTTAPRTEVARLEPVASNAVAQVQTPPATAPPIEPRAPTPRPSAPPETPLETVQLEAEPEFQPARDVVMAQPNATSPPPPARPAVAAGSPSPAVAQPGDAAVEEPRKRSLFARINPVNWFGSKESDAEKEQAKALEAQAAEEEKARRAAKKEAEKQEAERKEAEKARKRTAEADRRAAPPAPPPSTPAPPATPAFPRYIYAKPAPPARGNRAASDQLVTEGVRAHRAGSPADAQAAYARAVQADPANFNAQFNLAVAAFDLSDWSKSLAAYEQALAIAPDDLRARYGLALALERAGYPLDAADELERIVRKDPAHVEAHLAAANLYATTLADPARAREHYTRVLELQPSHPQAGMIKRWLGPFAR